ncbi:MAG TPA: hypothetical protein VIA06_06345 [Candidatus Dormibacteraeota bacterium]|nr:hypothetical protein [Candidatus Dormibacteraeota bacterium]
MGEELAPISLSTSVVVRGSSGPPRRAARRRRSQVMASTEPDRV